jgi:hypothetical protein
MLTRPTQLDVLAPKNGLAARSVAPYTTRFENRHTQDGPRRQPAGHEPENPVFDAKEVRTWQNGNRAASRSSG